MVFILQFEEHTHTQANRYNMLGYNKFYGEKNQIELRRPFDMK